MEMVKPQNEGSGIGVNPLSRKLWSFPGGIHPPMHKEESITRPIAIAELPKRLVLPLHQHIGAAASADVKQGDYVLKGQRIAHADGYVSVALHAPSSGTVEEIGECPVPHPSGLQAPCIVIKTDGEDKWIERQPENDYESMDPSHLRNLIREAGMVGLGGAGFPSFIKLNPGSRKVVDMLILNGIECEPYITCDDMLMRERADEIIAGARIMQHALHAKKILIAIEDNKPDAFDSIRNACAKDNDIEVVRCPVIYPQGSEKQLIQVITGQEIPSNSLPIQLGLVVHNVGTAAAVYRAIIHGEPLISRVITITGSGVSQPRNLHVLLGTPIHELLTQCGGPNSDMQRLIMGGPMMGFALHTDKAPVIKTTNCIIASTPADLPNKGRTMPCIRCGACADVCPVSLLPQQLYWYTQANDFDNVQDYNLFDCIECGCCAYVCPSNIPLVHYYRYAKTEIWSQEREKEKANIARQRHEFRLERIEQGKADRAARHKKKRDELKAAKTSNKEPKQENVAILAAIERVKAKKDASHPKTKNVVNLTDEQKNLIDEVDERRAKLASNSPQQRK